MVSSPPHFQVASALFSGLFSAPFDAKISIYPALIIVALIAIPSMSGGALIEKY